MLILRTVLKAISTRPAPGQAPGHHRLHTSLQTQLRAAFHSPHFTDDSITNICESFTLHGGLSRWLSGKESACQCRRCGFDPWVRKICWRRKWQPTPVFLPRKFHVHRSLVGYSPLSKSQTQLSTWHTCKLGMGTGREKGQMCQKVREYSKKSKQQELTRLVGLPLHLFFLPN